MKDSTIVSEAIAAVLPQYDRPWFKSPHLLKLYLILIFPLLSSAVAGYDGGSLASPATSMIGRSIKAKSVLGSMMNGLQATTAWKNYFGHPTGSVLGVVNAAQSIGSFISLPFVSILFDKIGRRWTLLAGAVTIVVASIIQAAAVDYAMFVIARVIVGVGSMLVFQPAPMLITELCYPTHRGKYTSLF
jgi:MFS family permease